MRGPAIRGNGMAIWQTISDTLVEEIETGALEAGGRLPGDAELAVRFGVNRHTVRRALAHLQSQGLVRSERGRGTFVVEDAISYRFGTRTRFEQNLQDNMRMPSRSLLSTTIYGAPADIAGKLRIEPGDRIFVADMLGEADGLPVHVARLHLPLERLPLAEDVFGRIPLQVSTSISLTALMAELGVANFRRKTSRIRCRLPLLQEARHLKMSPQEPVFELDVLNVDDSDVPVFHGLTCYCGSRIEFILEY